MSVAFGTGACAAIESYERGGRIGEGTYGVIYRATERRAARRVVALKRLLPHNAATDGFPLTSLREVHALRRLRGHENVVKLLEVAVGNERDEVFLVLELVGSGDLGSILDRFGRAAFDEANAKRLSKQLLSALRHCHDAHVVHRDVKVANLLYSATGVLKLCDFGLARVVTRATRALTRHVVTLWYRAPEVLLGSDRYGSPIDLWAAGCVIAEILRSGRPLLDGNDEAAQLQRIFEVLGAPSEAIWPGVGMLPLVAARKVAIPDHATDPMAFYSTLNLQCPSAGQPGLDFLATLLCYDPAARATAREALRDRTWLGREPLPTPASRMPRFAPDTRPAHPNPPPGPPPPAPPPPASSAFFTVPPTTTTTTTSRRGSRTAASADHPKKKKKQRRTAQ